MTRAPQKNHTVLAGGDVIGLVLQAKGGDTAALEKLLVHPVVQSRALMICQRIIRRSPSAGYYRDAEDLRQDLFISFWRNLDKLSCEHGEASLWRFFEIVARNIHLTQARKSAFEMRYSEEKGLDKFDLASREDQHLHLAIDEAMNSLDQRELSILGYKVQGLGLSEIVDEAPFKITKATVLRILENIQKKFVAALEGSVDRKKTKGIRRKKARY